MTLFGGSEHGAHAARWENDVGIEEQVPVGIEKGEEAIERGGETEVSFVLNPFNVGELLADESRGIIAGSVIDDDNARREAIEGGRHGVQSFDELRRGVIVKESKDECVRHIELHFPITAVEGAILDSLEDVGGGDGVRVSQVSDGTGDAEDAFVSAGREAEFLDSEFEGFLSFW